MAALITTSSVILSFHNCFRAPASSRLSGIFSSKRTTIRSSANPIKNITRIIPAAGLKTLAIPSSSLLSANCFSQRKSAFARDYLPNSHFFFSSQSAKMVQVAFLGLGNMGAVSTALVIASWSPPPPSVSS